MKILKSFSLRRRMVVGFGIVLICFVGALAFGIYGLSRNSSQLEHTVELATEVGVANDIKENFLNGVIAFKSYVEDGDEISLQKFEISQELLDEYILLIKTNSDDPRKLNPISIISDDVKKVREKFELVKVLKQELSDNYAILASTGYRMLDNLDYIKLATDGNQFDPIHREVTDSIELLLFARLHASKFFNFHTEEEYDSYLNKYDEFMQDVDLLGIQSDLDGYEEEYLSIKSDMKTYKDGMKVLHDKINEIDRILRDVEEINPEVNDMVNRIVMTTENELNNTQELSVHNNNKYNVIMIVMSLFAIMFAVFVVFKILEIVLRPINYLGTAFKELTQGETNTDFRLDVISKDEIGEMSTSFNEFMVKLGELIEEVNLSNYIKTAHTEMGALVRDEMNIMFVCERLLTYMSNYTEGVVGSFYIRDDNEFVAYSTYAHSMPELDKTFRYGENFLGEIAKKGDVRIIRDVESIAVEGNYKLKTSVVDTSIHRLVVIPCVFDGEVNGLVELGYIRQTTAKEKELFVALANNLGALLNSAKTRIKMKTLLDRTMHQAEELQMQQEELKQSNEELEEQTRALKESESRLQAQQEELRVSNEELEERSKQLEIQKSDLDIKNKAILASQEEVLRKAQELEIASRYKTEFLANMSHELRTPLNSILVLSQLLETRNNTKPLSSKEVEFASTINRSGNDLLTLINGVLDLSKVEAGKLELHIETCSIESIVRDNKGLFEPLTEIKDIDFVVDNQFEEGFMLKTDSLRINQITKNLLSNAIKFTHEGSVSFIVRRPTQSEINRFERHESNDIVFEVKDTGIGIPQEKQEMIFEAFKQNDGSTARSYGGTGLGLTIALQLANIMDGTIYIDSIEGQGSSFIFITPVDLDSVDRADTRMNSDMKHRKNLESTSSEKSLEVPKKESGSEAEIDESKENKGEEFFKQVENSHESTLLIIEDDEVFANLLKELCSEKGYTTYVAHTGTHGIERAKELLPDGIILDIGLPDIEGLEVAKILENTEETSSIPIHIISGDDADTSANIPKSIIGFLKKPVDIKSIYQTLAKIEAYSNKGLKKLLVVGYCGGEAFDSFKNLGEIEIDKVKSGTQALELLTTMDYGCIVLDAQLEDMRGVEFLGAISRKTNEKIPIIIYTESEIETNEYNQMKEFTTSIILKSNKSKDRLTDEVNLFLHDMKTSMEQFSKQSVLTKSFVKENIKDKITKEDSLQGKKVLVADDDDRNIFALTHALEHLGMDVVVAEDGRMALDLFQEELIDIVLMDIMMPEMDGYEATRLIRALPRGKEIPIIALTAKAMKEDREKCIKAGANDYMTKPIDVNKLTSLLKVWLA